MVLYKGKIKDWDNCCADRVEWNTYNFVEFEALTRRGKMPWTKAKEISIPSTVMYSGMSFT